MKTFKEYAKENGITYEAVRKKVEKYASDLDGHVLRQGKTRYLDDVAVDFLNKLKGEEVVIYNVPKEDEILKLKQQNELLQAKLFGLQEELIKSEKKYSDLQGELLEERNKVVLLTQENTRLQITAKAEDDKHDSWLRRLFKKTSSNGGETVKADNKTVEG